MSQIWDMDLWIHLVTCSAYHQHQRAYRKGSYKLIEYVKAPDFNKKTGEFISGSRVTQLYKIYEDPLEINNLSYFPEFQRILEELQTEMKSKSAELGDSKESVDYDYYFWDYYWCQIQMYCKIIGALCIWQNQVIQSIKLTMVPWRQERRTKVGFVQK